MSTRLVMARDHAIPHPKERNDVLGSTGGAGHDHCGFVWRPGRLRPVAMAVALEWEIAHLALHHSRQGAQPAWGSRCRSTSVIAWRIALASRRGGKRGLAGHLAPRDVQGAGKRQPVRVHLGLQGGLVHEGADGVVDQQVRPDLLADPVGIAAAQHHSWAALMGLQLIQRGLRLPPLRIQRWQLRRGRRGIVKSCGSPVRA